MLDTYVQFKVAHPQARSLVATAKGAMEQVEQRLNRYADDSAVAQIQADSGAWVEVDPIIGQAFLLARKWGDQTDGRFDITLGRVLDLYDFGGSGRVPSPAELAEALVHVGPASWELNQTGTRVRMNDPKTLLDFGGLHKGLAADLAAAPGRQISA